MRISLALPTQHPDALSASERPFRFTVPQAPAATSRPIAEAESAPGWRGVTAGWLAAADGAA